MTGTVAPADIKDTTLRATGQAVSADEGQALNDVTVATFTCADSSLGAGDFTASINWGDGTVTTGTTPSRGLIIQAARAGASDERPPVAPGED